MKFKFETTLHAKVIVEATATPQKHGGVEIKVKSIVPERYSDPAVDILDALHPIDIDIATSEAMTEYTRRQAEGRANERLRRHAGS